MQATTTIRTAMPSPWDIEPRSASSFSSFAQRAGVVLLMALLRPVVAYPQQQQPLPGVLQPGPIERATRPPPAARAEPSERQREGFKPIPPPQPGEILFVLQGVELDGVSASAPGGLFEEVTPLLRKSISLSQLQVAATNIAVRYHSAGFLLAQAFVPVQTVQDGMVRIRVIEGQFGTCRFDDQSVAARSLLQRYADKLCSIRPMKVAALERYLLLMNDVPGVKAQAIIVPARTEGGDPDLIIRINRKSASAAIGVSNRETEALGTWRTEVDGELYNAFGWDGRHWVHYRHTPGGGLNLASVGQELPLGHNGAKWSTSLLGSQTKAAVGDAQVNSELYAFNLGVSYPWLRRRTHNLTVRGAFSALDARSELDGLLFSEDRLRSARLGLTYDIVDRARGSNVIDLEVSQGLDALGAYRTGSVNASRVDGRSDYTKLNLYMARLQPISSRLSLLTALQGQYTEEPLLAPEQFALGGEQWLRAYDAAELLGDRGFGVKLEVRYNLVASGAATTYGFYEYGRVYLNDSSLRSQGAATAGAGIRFTLWRQLNAYIEGAFPLGRDVAATGDRNPRVFGGVRLVF